MGEEFFSHAPKCPPFSQASLGSSPLPLESSGSAPVCSSQGTAVVLWLPFIERSDKCSRSAGTHIQAAASAEAPCSAHRHVSRSQRAQCGQILGSKYVVFLLNNKDVASWSPRPHVRQTRCRCGRTLIPGSVIPAFPLWDSRNCIALTFP